MLALLGNRYVIGAVAAVGLLVAVWYAGNRHGRLACEANQYEAARDVAAAYAEQADGLRAGAAERRSEVRTVIREVYRETDPTGCADQSAIDGVLDALRSGAD